MLNHYKSQTNINKILKSPGIYILLPGKLQKYNAWTKTNGKNYRHKNTKGVKEDKSITILIKNNNDNNKKRSLNSSSLTIIH